MKKENIYIVLDRPQIAANIATASRAMANFGLFHLRMVKPKSLDKTHKMAKAGTAVLDQAELFDTLQEAVSDLHWVIGTTGRDIVRDETLYTPIEAVETLAKVSAGNKVGLVFGHETSGMNNEQMELMDQLTHIPTNPDHPSLNLAHSVALFAWEINKRETPPVPWKSSPPAHEKRQVMFNKMDMLMKSVGVVPDGRKRVLMEGVKRFLNREPLDERDVSFLLRCFNLFQRHLDENTHTIPNREKSE